MTALPRRWIKHQIECQPLRRKFPPFFGIFWHSRFVVGIVGGGGATGHVCLFVTLCSVQNLFERSGTFVKFRQNVCIVLRWSPHNDSVLCKWRAPFNNTLINLSGLNWMRERFVRHFTCLKHEENPSTVFCLRVKWSALLVYRLKACPALFIILMFHGGHSDET